MFVDKKFGGVLFKYPFRGEGFSREVFSQGQAL
jgi:hypothetical protein